MDGLFGKVIVCCYNLYVYGQVPGFFVSRLVTSRTR